MRQKQRHRMPGSTAAFGGSGSIDDLLRTVRQVERHHHSAGRYEDKKQACEAHSGKRALERYGIRLSKEDRREVEQQVLRGTAVSLFKQSCSRHHYAVKVAGRILPIVWDRVRKVIITVLPPEAMSPYAEIVGRRFCPTDGV